MRSLITVLALFAALVPIVGLGILAAVIPLILYTLVILFRNVVAGFDAVPPDVREAADDRLDQVVVACIVLKEGSGATEADIRSFLRERVAAYKVPKRFVVVADDGVPMLSSGKVDLRALKELLGAP